MKVLFIIVVLVVLAAINAASYAIMTYLPKKDTTRGLDIMAVREFVGADTAIYLIGGMMSPPTVTQFEPVLEIIPSGIDVYMTQFLTKGFNLDQAANVIMRHIKDKRHQNVIIIPVSLGYQVAVRVANYEEVKLLPVCPCIGRDVLTESAKWKSVAGYAIAFPFSILIGWLALRPMIRVEGGRYSLRLLVDQTATCAKNLSWNACGMIGDSQTISYAMKADGLVLAEDDTLIDNEKLLTYVTLGNGVKPLVVESADHYGNDQNHRQFQERIAEALRPLLKSPA